MAKKLFILSLIFAVFSTVMLAQSNKLQPQKARVASEPTEFVSSFYDDFHRAKNEANNIQANTQLFYTNYDYPTNNSSRRRLSMADVDGDGVKDPVYVNMRRISDADGTGTRNLIFGYVDIFGGDFFSTHATDEYSGWGELQVIESGFLDGMVLVTRHFGGESYFSTVDLASLSASPLIGPVGGNFPSFSYLPDGTIWLTTGGTLFLSTNQGPFADQAPLAVGQIGADPEFGDHSDSEYGVRHNPGSADGYPVAIVGSMVGDGHVIADGVDPSMADGLFLQTYDGAKGWAYERISSDGLIGEITNRPTYAGIFENFAQTEHFIDMQGTIHVVANGYSYSTAADTATGFVFPVVYWNNKAKAGWTAVTTPALEELPLADYYPGNGIGNSYPSMGASEDGMFLFCIFQGPELDGNGDVVIYPGDGGDATLEVAQTDLMYTYSVDGGATWTDPALVPGAAEANVQESYPYVDKFIPTVDKSTATVSYMFYVDDRPGCSLFTENDPSDDGYWVHGTMDIDFVPAGVEEVLPTEFALEQNYPNPFNPTTNIKFSIPNNEFVTVKVYDILGREVASLVNNNLTAGNHEINFDASELVSGMYIYEITAGNFVSAKKMMLLK